MKTTKTQAISLQCQHCCIQWIQASLNSKSALLHKCTRRESLSTQQDRWANVHTLYFFRCLLCAVSQSTQRRTQMSNMVTRPGFHQSLVAIRQSFLPLSKIVSAFIGYRFCLVLVLFSLLFFAYIDSRTSKVPCKTKALQFLVADNFLLCYLSVLCFKWSFKSLSSYLTHTEPFILAIRR